MLNLAGIDLIVDSPGEDAISFINKYIELASYRPWTRPSWPGAQASTLTFGWPRREPAMKLNRFVWPNGASRWAFGHFLASSDQVSDIMAKAYSTNGQYNPITFKIGTPDVDTSTTDPTTQGQDNIIVASKMYVLPPTPLSGIRGLKGNTQSLYLITIVDNRFFWYEGSAGITDTHGGTWDSLYRQVFLAIKPPVVFTIDSIADEYLSPSPSMFNVAYQPVPFILDAIAFNVGQRIVVGYDGGVATRNATVESNALFNNFAVHPKTRFVMAGGAAFSNPL